MKTPRDLIRVTWDRLIQLAFLKGNIEDYVLFNIVKLTAFVTGVLTGYYIWSV